VLKGGPSLRTGWREGEEKPEPIGLTGERDEALEDGPSGVEPMLRNFMALPFEGVKKVLPKSWEPEKLLPGVKTAPKGFMPPFCYRKHRVSNDTKSKKVWDGKGMMWERYKKKKT
jgi:hypothetical protein